MNHHSARQGEAGRGVVRLGKAWQGFQNSQHVARRGDAGRGRAWLGKARQGRDFMTGHTSVRKGKAVIVFLRDGRQVRGYFREQRGRCIALEDGTKIPKSELRCVTINKQP